MLTTEPRAGVQPPALESLYPNPTGSGNVPVAFRDLHPLARVRALRTMAARSGVDRHGFEVLTALALRMDEHGRAEVGQVRLATEARCCERTVRTRLAALERAGLFMRFRSGPRGLTRYQLAAPTADALDGPTAARVTASVQTGTGTALDARQEPLDALAALTELAALDARQTAPGTEPDPTAVQTGTGTELAPVQTARPDPVRPAPPVFTRPARPARHGAAVGPEQAQSKRRSDSDPRPILAPRRQVAALTARIPTAPPDPVGALAALRAWRDGPAARTAAG